MLTEKRQEEIVRLVYERESITVAELKEILHSSESTIRRDIIALDQEGRLTKVFGGAIALRTAQIVNKELSMVQKKDLQTAEEQADYVKYIRNAAAYYWNDPMLEESLNEDTRLITLSTCHGLHSNNRTVIHGVLVASKDR